MKLLKTIRLDPSDTFVFARAAQEGEWAVSGGFLFANADEAALNGKERAAFRSGFLGVPSLGWSTLVQVVEANADARRAAVELLAANMRTNLGAPDDSAAHSAAEEEIAFAASLAEHPPGTLIAVRRIFENGAIRETFRTLRPRGERKPMRAFSFLDVDGEEAETETVDLAALATPSPKPR